MPFRRPIVLAFVLALALALHPAPGLCAGARPWFAPGEQNATEAATASDSAPEAKEQARGKAPAEDPSLGVQESVLRSYYQYMMSLDERLPQLFSRRVRDGEALALESMRMMQRKRGTLASFASARVYLEGLRFTRITGDPDLARWEVKGAYHVGVASAFETVEEDALFVLLPEDGVWKIFERRDGAR